MKHIIKFLYFFSLMFSVRSKALACLSTAASSDDNHELTSAISRAVFNFTHVDPLLMETPQGICTIW